MSSICVVSYLSISGCHSSFDVQEESFFCSLHCVSKMTQSMMILQFVFCIQQTHRLRCAPFNRQQIDKCFLVFFMFSTIFLSPFMNLFYESCVELYVISYLKTFHFSLELKTIKNMNQSLLNNGKQMRKEQIVKKMKIYGADNEFNESLFFR